MFAVSFELKQSFIGYELLHGLPTEPQQRPSLRGGINPDEDKAGCGVHAHAFVDVFPSWIVVRRTNPGEQLPPRPDNAIM